MFERFLRNEKIRYLTYGYAYIGIGCIMLILALLVYLFHHGQEDYMVFISLLSIPVF